MASSPTPEFPPLDLPEYKRYGRQMILDGFGLEGQQKLKAASVLVVGAGGLGCPALQYLAAAGVGRIGIVDHDTVESSNLQRQILHNEETLGLLKADSAAQFVRRLNSLVQVTTYPNALHPSNALEIMRPYDIILDCTDNLPTRYLLSDSAVALDKPLVSGAAMRFEGQLCVYNLNASSASSTSPSATPDKGPCYRCLFPTPAVGGGTCEEVGILGVVTGVIGNLQAAEAIKIILGKNEPKPSLLLYSFLYSPPFRSIKLRGKKANCAACGDAAGGGGIDFGNMDYVQMCGGATPDWLKEGMKAGSAGSRVTPQELKSAIGTDSNTVILDVRPRTEYGICSIEGSTNIPITELLANPSSALTSIAPSGDVYVVCRLGNDSQLAADALRQTSQEVGGDVDGGRKVVDVIGGLRLWSRAVDEKFPVY